MSGTYRPKIQLSGQRGGTGNYCAALSCLGADPAAGCCPEPDLSCAGLVLCGGGDIDCALYGQSDQGSGPPDRERDRAELALFHAFFQAGKPILGICRGMQVINVALGGDLIQDLPPAVRAFHTGEGDLVHAAAALPGSLLAGLYGPVFAVNSAHHQGLGRLGEGLRLTAWSEGGAAEGLDLPGYPLLGVQFHPERMAFARRRADTVDGAPLLAAFLALCRRER